MNIRLRTISILVGTLYCIGSTAAFSDVEVSSKKAGTDELTILKPTAKDESAEFCLLPPDKKEGLVDLSIAAAFTTKTSSISGIAICNGKKVAGPVNTHLGGTAIFLDGNYEIFPNEHGTVLSADFIADLQKAGGSLFQQFLLVRDSKAQAFKDSATAPRRALVVFNTGERGVVQSVKEMTLGQFAHDMQIVGVRAAIYTPVGDADGGWYRHGDKFISIGKSSSPTPIQSNWVVWKKDKGKRDLDTVNKWLQEHKNAAGTK